MAIVSSVRDIGTRMVNAVWRIGFASRFFLMTLIYSGTSFRRFRLTVREMFSSGVMSLIIILVAGMFVGMVLGLQGYETLKRYGSESALGTKVSHSCGFPNRSIVPNTSSIVTSPKGAAAK